MQLDTESKRCLSTHKYHPKCAKIEFPLIALLFLLCLLQIAILVWLNQYNAFNLSAETKVVEFLPMFEHCYLSPPLCHLEMLSHIYTVKVEPPSLAFDSSSVDRRQTL